MAKAIISGAANVSMLELNTNFTKNIRSPAIQSVFKSEEDTLIGLSTIKILVDRFADSFGFSTKMNASQSETLCIDTFDNFRGESLGDIILFFKMARNGYFGSTHRGIDSNLIFGDWFPKYMEQKSTEREKIYQKEKKEQIKPEITIEDVRRSYEKHNASMLQKVNNYVEKITEGITRDELETIISEWRKDEEKSKYIRILTNKRLFIK